MKTFYSGLAASSIPPIKSFANFSAYPAALKAPPAFGKGSLGTITETPSANPAEVRKRRYQLLYYAKKLLPKERIAGCLFKRVDAQQGVKVLFNKSRNKANYGNLQRCANPWACPYCSAKITESRKVDVRKAMDGHLATGGYVYLMTLTNSHNATHSLKFLKEGQREAMRRFMGGTRESRSLFAALGKQHHINSYEVTHGQNGFHPHHHVLLFVASKLEDDALQVLRDQLAAEWIHCCSKAGLPLPESKLMPSAPVPTDQCPGSGAGPGYRGPTTSHSKRQPAVLTILRWE